MRPSTPLVIGRRLILREKLYPYERTHIYLIGATGTGKTSEIHNLILQDIEAGRSVGLIDVHSDLSRKILKAILHVVPREERKRRVVLLDPVERPFALNPLEVKGSRAYGYILELQSVFKKIWSEFWGPRLSDLLRNSFLVAIERGLTLDQIPRLLTDQDFRREKIEELKERSAREYFELRFEPLPRREKAVWIESFLNKLSEFTGDPVIRRCLCQRGSTVDFKEIINRPGVVLLISLPRAILKENTDLFAALIISKIEEAALERVEIPEQERRPFYLYLDEFQNFVASSSVTFQTILSEARKYRLFLTLAHQNLKQIEEGLLESILSNCSCLISFRTSRKDAELLAKEIFRVDPNEIQSEREEKGSALSLSERWEMKFNALTGLKRREALVAIKGRGTSMITTIRTREFKVSEEELKREKEELLSLYSSEGEEEEEIELKPRVIIEV